MTLTYFQLLPESTFPDISILSPFRCILVAHDPVTVQWQTRVSAWLVRSGCLYMLAWGKECSSWNDSVDITNLDEFNFGEVPETKFVMTTWHEKETLEEVFWEAKNIAFHTAVEIKNTLILDISADNHENEYLSKYTNVDKSKKGQAAVRLS